MFRFIILITGILLCTYIVRAQNSNTPITDSLRTTALQEVVVISQHSLLDRNTKALSTVDHYLEKANAVNMVRRGSYAWEPFLNGMPSERSVITVDGMRIYAACTDKMDPVTSYVEITNLAKANIHNGQGSSTAGATIAGSIDLVRKKTSFDEKKLSGIVFNGLESNNRQKILGTSISHSQKRFFTDVDFTYRQAQNYKAGGGEEILYSPFTKYNVSAIAGYKFSEHQHIEASLIYDRAVDVGYPALPMDVSLAKAWIASVEYIQHHVSPAVHQWKTKVYFNDVTHVMDDTKRPVVPIRMDMPGWSKTAGFYSLIEGETQKHRWKMNVSGHHNRSLAEMTMFSNTPSEKDMFMLTWPGVHTNYIDWFAEDNYPLSENRSIKLGFGLGVHNNQLNNQFGLESLQIFYPDIEKNNTRLLKRIVSSFQYDKNRWLYTLGAAYGERAPGVSEGYGFYLFNSFDRFDYIGNPNMKNEKSIELNNTISYKHSQMSLRLTNTFFHIRDYIIGRPQPGLSVMTIGAAGVKIYEQLRYAHLFNSTLDVSYYLSDHWLLPVKLTYRRGIDSDNNNLPLMQPFSYTAGITYAKNTFSADVHTTGALKQHRYSPDFGETPAAAYAIVNVSASYQFSLGNQSLTVKTGIENLFDTYYTTFSDWNRLPRMGRNVFIHLVYNF